MKKIFIPIVAVALIAVSITSCQSDKKGSDTSTSDSTIVETKPDTTVSQVLKDSTALKGNANLMVKPEEKVVAPTFSSEDVNNGFAKFEPLKQEYIAAIKSADAAKIKAVAAKYRTWMLDAATWGSKLTKEENQIFIDHYTKLITQWDKLTETIKK